MLSWQYNEKLVKDLLYNHSRDFGRFYCQLMLDSPMLYKEMMEGFYEELKKRTTPSQEVKCAQEQKDDTTTNV